MKTKNDMILRSFFRKVRVTGDRDITELTNEYYVKESNEFS